MDNWTIQGESGMAGSRSSLRIIRIKSHFLNSLFLFPLCYKHSLWSAQNGQESFRFTSDFFSKFCGKICLSPSPQQRSQSEIWLDWVVSCDRSWPDQLTLRHRHPEWPGLGHRPIFALRSHLCQMPLSWKQRSPHTETNMLSQEERWLHFL